MFASNRIRGLANGIGIDVSGSRSPAHAEPFSSGRGPHMSRSSLKALSLWLAAVTACLLSSPAGAEPLAYQMVTVGNSGNASDTRVGNNTLGRGTVNYSYLIGKYNVTIGQYTAFLNAVDPNGINPNGIYRESMTSNNFIGGISYTALASTGQKYSVIGPFGAIQSPQATAANRPVTYVTWFSAARFANWMTNGQGGPGTEATGAYTLNNQTSGTPPVATPGAAFRLPTTDEWYKAAYYSPNYGGVGVPGYYAYATQSDTAPGNQIGSAANQANWAPDDVYSLTQTGFDYSGEQNYLTDVGAFSGSGSFYGTFDQSGLVGQLNDLDGTGSAGLLVGVRGGGWLASNPVILSSSYQNTPIGYQAQSSDVGFRLVSPAIEPVPEIDPAGMGSVLALVTGALGLLERRRLKAKSA